MNPNYALACRVRSPDRTMMLTLFHPVGDWILHQFGCRSPFQYSIISITYALLLFLMNGLE